MSEKEKPSILLKPDGKPVEKLDVKTNVQISEVFPTMSCLKPQNIFILAIPLKTIPWNQVKIILAEAFQELSIMFHYIEKKNLENGKKKGITAGVGQFMKQHIDSFMGKGEGEA